ncbi:uncharacterized protein EV154DRAFT_556372 [Mucor mucedo]|uniref:uncharacterized protein n=1 Tax=Mucor mucedo TaxID=29922 RepID=UPI00221EB884|nr:uncharacterized protein EV154DRAFT_556372 [Mucor mucedo]KAI7873167.1 hypothetical protein EV154DRAFT_556372 [Mucor mucedo]
MQQETPAVCNDQRDLGERVPYLTECRFEETEGLAHAYNNAGIISSFPSWLTRTKFLERDTEGCDDQTCPHCNESRYKNQNYLARAATTTIMSVSDMLSQMLADPKIRDLTQYRVNRETSEGGIRDFFDGRLGSSDVNSTERARNLQSKGTPSNGFRTVADNRRGVMYFDDNFVSLRPLSDFKQGNPPSILSEFLSFLGSLFFALDELHLIARGIARTDGSRAVDWLNFLLYVVPTLIIPQLPTQSSKTAILSLVKGFFQNWHEFLVEQMENKVLYILSRQDPRSVLLEKLIRPNRQSGKTPVIPSEELQLGLVFRGL